MSYHRVVINNYPYVLTDPSVRERLAAAMVAAVRSGGDFVHIRGADREVDVLVTPATDARIELVETTELQPRLAPSFDPDLDWVDLGI